MTRTELAEAIEAFGLDFAYYQFPTGKTPKLPFICYYSPSNSDFFADNENHVAIEGIVIELYEETRDFELEESIEAQMPFPYDKTTEYINQERMYRITYESEVIISGEE